MRPNLAVVPSDDFEPEEKREPINEATDQYAGACERLDLHADAYLRFPFLELDKLCGGIAPGEVWFVGAFSGHGKTTFLMSALDRWYTHGKRVYYMGLETRPQILRTSWACSRLSLDVGMVTSGNAARDWPDWKATRERIKAEMLTLAKKPAADRVYFSPVAHVGLAELQQAAHEASELEADVFIIDHIDHIDRGEGPMWDGHVRVIDGVLKIAQEYGLKVIASTQFNNDALRGNPIGLYLPPQPQHVYMGGNKRQIASGMIGLYRPISPAATAEQLAAFRRRELEPQHVLAQNTMACVLMKSRNFGGREGSRCFLSVDNGRVTDMAPIDHDSLVSPVRGGSYQVR